MTNRLLTLAVIGAVGAGSATVAVAHQGRGPAKSRTQIATVTSYASGTLTLKTTSGETLFGKVTRRTRIDCVSLSAGTTPAATTPADAPPATTPGDGTPPTSPAGRRPGGRGEDERGPGGERGGRLQREDDDDAPVCDTSSLTAGIGVVAASTDLSATGQKFTRVVLVSSAASDATTSN